MIQFQVAPCIVSVLAEKVLGNMRRQQIEKDSPVAVLQSVHLLFLFFGLTLPQNVQSGRPLHLASVQDDPQEEEQQLEGSHSF
jgi:hypothetical protein